MRRLLSTFCALLLSFALGCSMDSAMPDTVSTTPLGSVTGRVHGGQQPIVGAHVFVFAASINGFGGAGLDQTTENASKSLLKEYTSGAFPTKEDTNIDNPTYEDYYVTTDSGGNFELTGEYTCTEGEEVYLYTSGGNPGSGANSRATLMAVLGTCPASGTMADLVPYVEINEVSTVAAAFAVGGLASGPLHIGDDEGVHGNTYAALAKTGMAVAFGNAAQIVDVGTGLARSTTPLGNGKVPQATINSLANSLAACVNSTGSLTGGCALLGYVTFDGNSADLGATDTASAAIDIAHYPGFNVNAIFSLAMADAPFAPTLSSAPNDWSVGIRFTGNGLSGPEWLAVDASDDVWVANNYSNEASRFSALGGTLPNYGLVSGGSIAVDASGNVWSVSASDDEALEKADASGKLSSFTVGGVSYPNAVALSGDGDVWVCDEGPFDPSDPTNAISLLSSSGGAISGSKGYTGGGLNLPDSVAVDGAGNAWIANYSAIGLSKFSKKGKAITGSDGYTGGGVDNADGLAIDSSGDVWAINNNDNVVAKFSNNGKAISESTGYSGGGLSSPGDIVLDGAGNVWIPNNGGNSVTELSSTGAPISGSSGYQGGEQQVSSGIGIDGAGNVWIANYQGYSLTELLGIAAPVITPISGGLPATLTSDGSSRLGTRP